MRLGNITVRTGNTLEMQEESTREGERKHTRNAIRGKAWEILQGKRERRHGQPASGKKEEGLKWPIGNKRKHVPQETGNVRVRTENALG